MSDLLRDFINENRDRIVCEPSGLTLVELRNVQVQRIMLINDVVKGDKV